MGSGCWLLWLLLWLVGASRRAGRWWLVSRSRGSGGRAQGVEVMASRCRAARVVLHGVEVAGVALGAIGSAVGGRWVCGSVGVVLGAIGGGLWAVGGSVDRWAWFWGAIGGGCGRPRLAVGVRWTKRNAISSDRWEGVRIYPQDPRGVWGRKCQVWRAIFLDILALFFIFFR